MIRKISLFGLVAVIILFSIFNSHDLHRRFIRSKVGNETVMIMNMDETAGGTGFYLNTPHGIRLITNRHVCQLANASGELKVKEEGKRLFTINKVIKINDTAHDLCMLDSKGHNSSLELANDVGIGDTTYIVGHPNLRPLVVQEGEIIEFKSESNIVSHIITPANPSCKWNKIQQTIDLGVVKLKVKFCVIKDYVTRMAMVAYGGNSGSALVNVYGRVVGVLFAGNEKVTNDSMAVSLEDLREFIK